MERVWLYLVVSSDAQEETLETQRRWGFEEAAKLGAEVDPKGIFEGVATGKHGARAILTDLIEKLRALPQSRRPKRILMTRLDRTGRMPLDAISALNEIRKLGVIVRDRINGDYTFARMKDQVGPIFQLLQAGFENEVRSDRSRQGYDRKRALGLLVGAKPPYGVLRGPDGKAQTDPVCGPYVQETFRRWNARESPVDIVRWLRAEAPPRAGRHGEIRIQWSLSHLYKLIHKVQSYRGVVVDEETWDLAQRRVKPESRPGSREHVYPYSGLTCHCGERLHPRTNGLTTLGKVQGRYKRYPAKTIRRWYVCQSLQHADGPKFRSFREDRIDQAWMALLRRLSLSKGPWARLQPQVQFDGRLATLERSLAALEAKRTRVHEAFEAGAYDVGTMQGRLAAVSAEERTLRGEIDRLRREQDLREARVLAQARIAELITTAATLYEQASLEERAALNRALMAAFGRPVISDEYAIAFPSLQRS